MARRGPIAVYVRVQYDDDETRFMYPTQEEKKQIFSQLAEELALTNCRKCGSSREACDARVNKHPKRCCSACKEYGPAALHVEE